MGYTTDAAFGFRIFGGVAGFLVSYVLFWGFYVERTGVHPKVKWFRTKKERRYAVDHPLGQRDRTFNARVAPVTQPPVTQPEDNELHTRHSAISFNNAYRYAYHAI
jgi:hypothetical protein